MRKAFVGTLQYSAARVVVKCCKNAYISQDQLSEVNMSSIIASQLGITVEHVHHFFQRFKRLSKAFKTASRAILQSVCCCSIVKPSTTQHLCVEERITSKRSIQVSDQSLSEIFPGKHLKACYVYDICVFSKNGVCLDVHSAYTIWQYKVQKCPKYLSSVGDVSHQGKSVSDLFLLDIMGLIILIV